MENTPFTALPKYVVEAKQLTAFDKLLYGKLGDLSHKDGYCFAGNKHIAEYLGVTPGHVSERISKLRDLGFIRVDIDRESGNRRKIYVGEKTTVTLTVPEFTPQEQFSTPIPQAPYTPIRQEPHTYTAKTVAEQDKTTTKNGVLKTQENIYIPGALARELKARAKSLAVTFVDNFAYMRNNALLADQNPATTVLDTVFSLLVLGKDIRLYKGKTIPFVQFVNAVERLDYKGFESLMRGFFEKDRDGHAREENGRLVMRRITNTVAYIVGALLKLTAPLNPPYPARKNQ